MLLVTALPASACPVYYGTDLLVTGDRLQLSVGGGLYPPGGTNNIDVLHYAIHFTDFDFSSETITAWAELRILITQPISTNDWLHLDFTPPAGAGITNLALNGITNAYSITSEGAYDSTYDTRLKITPPISFSPGNIITVRVDYAGSPLVDDDDEGGLRFITSGGGNYATTMAEPNSAHLWFPCNDTPDDKATLDLFATVSNGQLAASNGHLVEVITNAQKTTFHWRSTNLVSTYLVSMDVGDYVEVGDIGGSGVPLQGWFSPAKATQGSNGLVSARNAMLIFTNAFGRYPFDKYAHVEFFSSGFAMEHQTLSGFPSSALSGSSIIAHELAHHWFGNYAGFATWDDLWLAEGWATYSQALFAAGLDNRNGTAAHMNSRNSMNWNRALNAPDYDSVDSLFSYWLVYLRGAWVLHHIRSYLGEETFWKATRGYLDTYASRSATTDNFRDAFSDAAFSTAAESNRFTRFFERLKAPGWPKIRTTYFGETNAYGSLLYFRYDRWDDTPTNCPDVMYAKLQFVGGSYRIERLIWEETNTYTTLYTDLPVTGVIMDPFGDYPCGAANIIVNGTLSAGDADGDSLPDGWELVTLGTTNYTAADNPDGDALSNDAEYIAGLNPMRRDAFQVTGLRAMDASPTNRVLSWPYVPGREYSIYWATNISDAFMPVVTQLTDGTYTDGVHGGDPIGYYSVGVKKQAE